MKDNLHQKKLDSVYHATQRETYARVFDATSNQTLAGSFDDPVDLNAVRRETPAATYAPPPSAGKVVIKPETSRGTGKK